MRSKRFSFGPHQWIALLVWAFILTAPSLQADWQRANSPLQTKWAAEVGPANALPEYPRPNLTRAEWKNLNGSWRYAITSKDAGKPAEWKGEILVPFGIESALSGVRRPLEQDEALWYERSFTVPAGWKGKRVRLNFEAVDWEARVWVNGRELGNHQGGYTPFSFDITDALKPGENRVTVRASDPGDSGLQPLGKQRRANFSLSRGIFYTPTSGIWQTVWLEPVPESFIEHVRLTPDLDRGVVKARVDVAGPSVPVEVRIGKMRANLKPGVEQSIQLPGARRWSPEDPYLHQVHLRAGSDDVQSYFGMRKIETLSSDGHVRIFLNNKEIFQMGTLDQGFWPDGIHTPPTEAAMLWDLEMNKAHGFNLIRKHIKREPRRWYYLADKLGMLVWQDAVSSHSKYGTQKAGGLKPAGLPPVEGRPYYEKELKAMLQDLHNHPSIILWVVFNEGWGQYDTERLTREVMAADPSRLVCDASGWQGSGTGHISDCHNYPEPALIEREGQALVCGEFGGINYVVPGHIWDPKAPLMRGNRPECNAASAEEFLDRYQAILTQVARLKKQGLCAAVYTELADVEAEPNGFCTYDRVLKVDPAKMKKINDSVTQ